VAQFGLFADDKFEDRELNMNFKTTYILFGFLAGVFLLLAIALFMDPGAVESSGFLFPSMRSGAQTIQVDDVDRLEIDRKKPNTEKLVFELDPATKRWNQKSPRDTHADKFAIQEVVRQLREAKPDPEADRPSNLAQWGLDDPSAVVNLKKKDSDKIITLKIGNTSPGVGSAVVYVLSSDRPKEPLAVKKSLLDAIFKNTLAFREKDLLCPSVSDIKSFKLEETGKKAIALGKSGESRWKYTEPSTFGEADFEGTETPEPLKVSGGVRGLLNNLSNLKVDYRDEKSNDFVEDGAADLAKYKLDVVKDKVLSLTVERAEEGDKTSTAKLLVAVGEKVGEAKDKYYAMLDDGRKEVVRIQAANLEPILKLVADPEGLRDRTLVRLGALDKPDAINLTNSYGLLEFRRPDQAKPWMFYRPGKDVASAINELNINNLVGLLAQKGQIKSFVDSGAKEADLGLDKPVAQLDIFVEGIDKTQKKEEKKDDKKAEPAKDDSKKEDKKEEKKDEKKPEEKKEEKPVLKAGDPKVRILFGKKEGGLIAFKRIADKEVTYGKVAENILDKVQENPLSYLDATIPKFAQTADPSEGVNKLLIDKSGKLFDVSRDKKEDPWKIAQPSDKVGKEADANLIRNALAALSNLRPVKIAAEKPSDTDLAKEFGLAPAAIKAVVTLGKDKEAKTFEYLFGKESADKSGIFAKVTGSDYIFVVDKAALTALEAEFEDMSVFPRLDLAKVEMVKITGWQALLGSPFTIEAELKDLKWAVKAPADFKLDSAKVQGLLGVLSQLKAEKFITLKTGAKPEQELDLAKGALQIEFRLQGEKDTQKLVVGKAEGASYFATSSRLQGDVFLVPKGIFEAMRGKPAYFNP